MRTVPVPPSRPTFVDAPRCTDLDSLEADVAIIGVPYGPPYDMAGSRSPSSTSPETVRELSMRLSRQLTHYDFDFGGDILAGRNVRIVDCGDVAMVPGQYEANGRAATEVIQAIIRKGAVPFVLGGDHSVTTPAVRAYEGFGPLCIVHIDAHMDWRDEVNGVRLGLSSPMRRSSEMPWVKSMIQIGLRGVGSARQQEIDDARAFGSVLIGAEELHRTGVEAVLERLPASERYYISFDADGLDPSIAPGVGWMAFGGVTYYEATNILKGVASRGKVVGFDFVEIQPANDVANMTSWLAARLTMNLIGALAYTGQIGKA